MLCVGCAFAVGHQMLWNGLEEQCSTVGVDEILPSQAPGIASLSDGLAEATVATGLERMSGLAFVANGALCLFFVTAAFCASIFTRMRASNLVGSRSAFSALNASPWWHVARPPYHRAPAERFQPVGFSPRFTVVPARRGISQCAPVRTISATLLRCQKIWDGSRIQRMCRL